jgi:hypothetical protein
MKKYIILLLLIIPLNVFAYDIDINKYNTKNIDNILSDVGNDKYVNNNQTENGYPIYFFYGKECGYSKDFIEFYVNKVIPQYGNKIHIVGFETWHDSNNKNLMKQVLEYKKSSYDGSPLIIIGDRIFEGYTSSYDNQILSLINNLGDKDIFKDMNNISESDMSNGTKLILLSILFIILMISTFMFINKKSIKE